jgi:hypothetical protein
MPWTTETLLTAIGAVQPAECFTEADMAKVTGLTAKQVADAANNLRRHGFITRSARGCHALTPAGRTALEEGAKLRSGPKGPQASGHRRRAPGHRARVWTALRTGKKLTVDDILMRIVDGNERDPRSNVLKYVKALARAGYVQAMPQRERPLNPTSNGCRRWLLITDTGPEAPIHRVTRDTLYDPNLEREIALGREIEEGTV